MKEMIGIELNVQALQIEASEKPGMIKITFAVECDELEKAVDSGDEFINDFEKEILG